MKRIVVLGLAALALAVGAYWGTGAVDPNAGSTIVASSFDGADSNLSLDGWSWTGD